MNRLRKRRHQVEHDNVHRWLVSYADYMTLLFALFVVLYAMAMVNEKPFESITHSVGRVFQANTEQPKNKGHGDDILDVNTSETNKRLFGDGILETRGPKLVEGEQTLSNIAKSQVGTHLTSVEDNLNTALYELVESGFAQLTINGDWLEIELNSGLLFPSGSSSPTNSAKNILSAISKYWIVNDFYTAEEIERRFALPPQYLAFLEKYSHINQSKGWRFLRNWKGVVGDTTLYWYKYFSDEKDDYKKNSKNFNMKKLLGYFLQGLLYLVPISVTIYIVVEAVVFVDGIIPVEIPGLGLLTILVTLLHHQYLRTFY